MELLTLCRYWCAVVVVVTARLDRGHGGDGQLQDINNSIEQESLLYSSEYYDDLTASIPPPAVHLDFVYHNFSALTTFLQQVATSYPQLTHLYSIGNSVRGMSNLVFTFPIWSLNHFQFGL